MRGIFHNRRGFTLIELIVVVIIIGILAAVSAPMMTGNLNKAKTAEAVAALGALRTCARMYYIEHNETWPTSITYLIGDDTSYMKTGDLRGKYYSEDNDSYYIDQASNEIQATPITTGEGLKVSINMINGELTYPD